jgi:hypothetical protein
MSPPHRVWHGLLLIPPNPNGAVATTYQLSSGLINQSYATHWAYSSLGPGGSIYDPPVPCASQIGCASQQHGDLVFSVPKTLMNGHNPTALVYITPGHQPFVGAGASPGKWKGGPNANPNRF